MPRHCPTVSLTLGLLLTGCSAIHPDIQVSSVAAGNPNIANTSLSLGSGNTFKGDVVKTANGSYPSGSGVDLGLRQPGEYTASYEVSYQPLFSASEVVSTATAVFSVYEPDGCFSFKQSLASLPASHSTQGWGSSGYFVADTTTPATQTCSPSVLWRDDIGSSPAPDEDGGIQFGINANCLRTPATIPQWRFDFSSPDLTRHPRWQNLQAFSYLIRSDRSSNLDLYAQSIVKLRKADGSEVLVAEGTQGNRVFHAITGSNQTINSSLSIPAGATVLGASIRIFGRLPVPPQPDFHIEVDSICPR